LAYETETFDWVKPFKGNTYLFTAAGRGSKTILKTIQN
jgi:hypothetical protein